MLTDEGSGDRGRDPDLADAEFADASSPEIHSADVDIADVDLADVDLADVDLADADSADADSADADSADVDLADADSADAAAASALARARAVARGKGLRPGSRLIHKGGAAGRPSGSADQGLGVGGSGVGSSGSRGGGRDDGRDPTLLGEQMQRLLLDRGWNVDVAVGSVMGRWPAIVGAEVAQHCTPVTFSEGTLTVRADSTAWATQLRLMSSTVLSRLEAEVGKDTVFELRVHGPSAPSWTRGFRKSTGPGPRDTYG